MVDYVVEVRVKLAELMLLLGGDPRKAFLNPAKNLNKKFARFARKCAYKDA